MSLSSKAIGQALGVLPSCACDQSGAVQWEEVDIIRRIHAGEELIVNRHCIGLGSSYAISWEWTHNEDHPTDTAIMRLIGREAIKPQTCAGGFTTMILTERATELLNNLPGTN